jgi:hypothetical protein
MRYRLRTLLIVLAILPMLIGGTVNLASSVFNERERARRTACNTTLTLGFPGYSLPPAAPTRRINAEWRSRP